MLQEFLEDADGRMKGAITALESDLAAYRTGRASPAILDRLVVEFYGSELSLKQIALVSVPEPQQLAIRPFDVSSISAIERAILKSDLGLTPNNDGKIIRLNIPRLTEERRRKLVKDMGKRIEEARVSVRNVRRDVIKDMIDFEKEGELTEDDLDLGKKKVQEVTDKYIGDIKTIGEAKEAEIMEV